MSAGFVRAPVLVGFVLMIGHIALAAPPRTDAYGDPLPKDVHFRLGSVRLRHDGDVMALAWMPDGRTLASSSWDRTVRLWQIPGGKQIAKWDKMSGVIFSPDGRSLACGEGDEEQIGFGEHKERAIRLVDVATGKDRRRIRVPKNGGILFNFTLGYPSGVISPDGKILAVREGELGVRLYSVDNGKELRFLKAKVLGFGRPLIFAPDSRTLLVAADEGLLRWTIGTGAKAIILEDKEDREFLDSFAFSPDGKMLAALKGDGSVMLWSWPEGKKLRRIQMEYSDEKVLAFSPDSKLLAIGDFDIGLWNPTTGKRVRHFESHGDRIWDLAFSPDGSLLASAGADHAVIVWEVHAGKTPRPLTGVSHWLGLVGLAADGKTLLTRSALTRSGGGGVLTVWDSHDGHRLRTLANGEDGIESFLFGPDVSRKRALLRQDVENGRYGPASGKEGIRCTVFSPDNAMMAVGGSEGILLLRKTSAGIERRLLDDEARAENAKAQRIGISVSALTFSPDGRTLVACYTDGRLFLWDSRTGRPRHILSFPSHGQSYRSLDFSPNGRLLALSDRRALYLLEMASGQRFRELPLGGAWVDSSAFAPDNRTLAVGDAGSSAAIHLWDLPTEKEIGILSGHLNSIYTLVFSPDGSFLLSGGADYTVLSWDVAASMRRRPPNKTLSAARLSELWKDLAAKDAARAQRAVAEMIQSPDTALPFLEKMLPPVPSAKMAPIAAWIADLDHDQFVRRERASKELLKIGEDSVPVLRKVLNEKPTLETRKRIESLLQTMDEQEISPEWLHTLRALQVLETIGTPAARSHLERLADGADGARLTREAKAALQRLDRLAGKP